MINRSGPGIPEFGVESCDAKSSNDAVANPDEAGYPEEDVIFALKNGDVTALSVKTDTNGMVGLTQAL